MRSVELQLPGEAFMQDYALRAQAAGQPLAAAHAQLDELYQQFGLVQPLSTVSSAHCSCWPSARFAVGASGCGALDLARHGGAW